MSDASTPPELRVLLDVINCAFDKRSWHGPNLMSAIRGVDAALAARRVRGRKCIWEQVLHAAYLKHRIVNRLADATPFARRGSNWPGLPDVLDAAHWRADIALLQETQRRLREAVTALAQRRQRLDEQTSWLIHGAAAHDLYHAGQIKLLRKLLAPT